MQFIKESQSQGQDDSQIQSDIPTLTIIDDIEYDNPDTQWFMSIDIKDIWEQYKAKSLTFDDFTKKYNETLLGQQSQIQKIGDRCWNDLVEITNQVGEYNEEKANRYFNRIYDWGDEHGVKITTGAEQSQPQEEETETQEPQTQNNDTIQ